MRYVVGTISVALLAGCGGLGVSNNAAQPVPPSLLRVGGPAAIHPDRGHSWMSPAAKKKKALLYLDDEATGDVYVYSYPKAQLVGTLTGLPEPQGECTDKKGHIFITTFASFEILEYAHGGSTPIATLNNPNELMEGCSIDPKTGNLAAVNFETSSQGPAGVSIYKKAAGNPTVYSDPDLKLGYALGYDNAGNIFLDGADNSSNFEFAELPSGSSNFTAIDLGISVSTPGGVEWDGKYVTVGDATGGVVYQTTGAGGKIVATIALDQSNGLFNYDIDHKTFIGPNVFSADAMFWKYPVGGNPVKTISGFDYPFGVAISRKR